MGKSCRDVHLRVYIDEPADLLARLAAIETALTFLMKFLTKEDAVILSTQPDPTQPDPTQPDPNQPNPVDDGEPEPAPAQ